MSRQWEIDFGPVSGKKGERKVLPPVCPIVLFRAAEWVPYLAPTTAKIVCVKVAGVEQKDFSNFSCYRDQRIEVEIEFVADGQWYGKLRGASL